MASPTKVICTKLSEQFESALKDKTNVRIPVVSILRGGVSREMLVKPSSAVVISANVASQRYEPMAIFVLGLNVRFDMRLCDDPMGTEFNKAHEILWGRLCDIARGDNCTILGDNSFACDGFTLGGESEPTLDASADGGGVISCGFNATVTGRVIG